MCLYTHSWPTGNDEEHEKDNDDDENSVDLGLPVSVQTFLWRQIAPFIRPRLGKLHEASCMSFEKVLVQNIQFGLSPPLTKALGAIPRWRLLQGALPHVMHACAALLYCKFSSL
ncbi:GH23523 [Drosophila grimshawi]|uniref:GH23523 n=1 Tax=Drosophila grimshawi TaxID=7222 RepID=B4K326_DROGR|nr:GH23523 [Drosophila grimshawi]